MRYHGFLAPNAKDRDKIVPAGRASNDDNTADDNEGTVTRKYRLSWSALLARVFQIQAEVCSQCGGKMKIVAAVTDPVSVRYYLKGTGQSAEIPILAPARAPPQEQWDF